MITDVQIKRPLLWIHRTVSKEAELASTCFLPRRFHCVAKVNIRVPNVAKMTLSTRIRALLLPQRLLNRVTYNKECLSGHD